MDVDGRRRGQASDPSHDRAPAHQLLPPAATARPDHDLGDMVGASEVDEGLGRIVPPDLGPLGTDVGDQLSQYDQFVVWETDRIACRTGRAVLGGQP